MARQTRTFAIVYSSNNFLANIMGRRKATIYTCMLLVFSCAAYAQKTASFNYVPASRDFFQQIRMQKKFASGEYVLDTTAYFDDHVGDVIKRWSDYKFLDAIYHYQEVDSISKNDGKHWKEVDSIVFSPDDQSQILHRLNNCDEIHWDRHIIGSVQLIDFSAFTSEDTVKRNTILKDGVWVFTSPLFLHDESVCMVYYLKISSDNYLNAISFFRKDAGTWKEFRSVYSSGQSPVE